MCIRDKLYIDTSILDLDVYRTLQRGMDLRELADYKETFSENSARILMRNVGLSCLLYTSFHLMIDTCDFVYDFHGGIRRNVIIQSADDYFRFAARINNRLHQAYLDQHLVLSLIHI